MDERAPGLRQGRDGRGARLRRGKVAAARGSSWFSRKRTSCSWYAEVGVQVAAHRLGALVREPVVEALVVAVVEALLLERPLEIPVGLGDEDEVGMARLDAPG